MLLEKVISGGQTGVDRAALDAAMSLGIPVGGWCPAGRLAVDGVIPRHYPLRETPSRDYAERTAWNVRDADATLIINAGKLEGGTALTAELAAAEQQPCLVVQVEDPLAASRIINWLAAARPGVLNVAGPREEKRPGVYAAARAMLQSALPG